MNTAPKYFLLFECFAVAFLHLMFVPSVHAATVSYPRGTTSTAWAREPFALDQYGIHTCRYQQVYAADRFSDIIPDGGALPDGGSITQLLFVVDEKFPQGFSTDFPDIQIDFSVTRRAVDRLSTSFSENLGTNTVTVLPRGRLHMFSSGDPGTPIVVNLPVPFFYDPAAGNLLVDIRKYAPIQTSIPLGDPGVFDAWNITNDTVSRVYSYNVNSATGVADTIGLTTIFKVNPPAVPRLLLIQLGTTGADRFVRLRWLRVPGSYSLQQSSTVGLSASWLPYEGNVNGHQEYFEAVVPVDQSNTAGFFRLVSTNLASPLPGVPPSSAQPTKSRQNP